MSNVNIIGNFEAAGNAPGTVPLGGIIAIAANITGAMVVPNSGVVSNGWMRCDGAIIPSNQGNVLSGNTPTLHDSRFLMGSTTAGTADGNNSLTPSGSLSGTKNIDHTHTYSHTHGTDSQLGTIPLLHSHTVDFHRHEYSIALMDLNYMATGTNAAMGSAGQGGVFNYQAGNWQGASPGSVFSMTRVDSSGPTPNGVPTGVGNVQQYYSTGYTGAMTNNGTNQQLTNYNASHSHSTNSQSTSTTTGMSANTTVNGTDFTFTGNTADNRPLFLSTIYLIRVK